MGKTRARQSGKWSTLSPTKPGPGGWHSDSRVHARHRGIVRFTLRGRWLIQDWTIPRAARPSRVRSDTRPVTRPSRPSRFAPRPGRPGPGWRCCCSPVLALGSCQRRFTPAVVIGGDSSAVVPEDSPAAEMRRTQRNCGRAAPIRRPPPTPAPACCKADLGAHEPTTWRERAGYDAGLARRRRRAGSMRRACSPSASSRAPIPMPAPGLPVLGAARTTS